MTRILKTRMNYLLLFVDLMINCRASNGKEVRDVTITNKYSFEYNNEANGDMFSVTNLCFERISSHFTSNSKVTLILVAFIYVSENVKVSLGVRIEHSNQFVIQYNSQIFIKQCVMIRQIHSHITLY